MHGTFPRTSHEGCQALNLVPRFLATEEASLASSPQPPPSASVGPTPSFGGRNPRTVRLIVIVVALIVIVSVATVVYIATRPTNCRLSSTDPLIFDQLEQPDTIDPLVTFSQSCWWIRHQVSWYFVMA